MMFRKEKKARTDASYKGYRVQNNIGNKCYNNHEDIDASVVNVHVRTKDVEVKCWSQKSSVASPLGSTRQQEPVTKPRIQHEITPNATWLGLCNIQRTVVYCAISVNHRQLKLFYAGRWWLIDFL
jgi:hypothetical protein